MSNSDFSFGSTAGASQSTAKPRLTGNEIYEVKFDGCEIQDIQGVKDPTQVYRVLKLKFSNEDGGFEHTVFEPRSEDFSRKETEFTKNGKVEKIPQPSSVESMMLLLKHAIDSINPTVAKQIDSNEKSLGTSNWDELRKLAMKILDAGKGTSVKIKLLKNTKTGEATFPGFFTALTKENKAYVKNNFIGPKVAFNTYELDRIRNEASAKVTKVSSFDPSTFTTPEPAAASLDMSFDITDL